MELKNVKEKAGCLERVARQRVEEVNLKLNSMLE
jgi:hypothetical protein